MKTIKLILLNTIILAAQGANAGTPVETLLDEYRAAGAAAFSAEAGHRMWSRMHISTDAPRERRCASCHGDDLTSVGKHAKTGKTIEPLAPSANAERLTNIKDIRKWLKRNCKWTLDRECTPQEKGDFLSYIQQQ